MQAANAQGSPGGAGWSLALLPAPPEAAGNGEEHGDGGGGLVATAPPLGLGGEVVGVGAAAVGGSAAAAEPLGEAGVCRCCDPGLP